MSSFFNQFFPGQAHQADDSPQEAKETELYDLLGVTPDASTDDIRKAFKKLAVKHHPDRGGEAAKFKEINAAHEVLSDPEKRKLYDRYGLEGLKGQGAGAGGFEDIFETFFGGSGFRRQKNQKWQLKPTILQETITLKQAYDGCVKQLKNKRKKICGDCDGKGGSAVNNCTKCKGQGITVKMVQLGPGMYTQQQQTCQNCNGKGKVIPKESICKGCNGQQIINVTENVDVTIPVGFPNKDNIVIQGKGNEHPDYQAGDLVIVVQVAEDPQYHRINNDLYMTKKISLLESLAGFSYNLKHINDMNVTIQSPAGKTIKNQQELVIHGLGMHHYKNMYQNGDLYIKFEVEIPESLSKEQLEKLEQILPKRLLPKEAQTQNVYQLSQQQESQKQKKQQQQKNQRSQQADEYDDEQESEQQGGQRVECNQQ